ncbi:MAG: dienelactone hydrolase family protein [Candidatus Omnitrophica bacterium]|nr:dienelactone hydrolase family protein [Candidatus Omnitrophota bacterium]
MSKIKKFVPWGIFLIFIFLNLGVSEWRKGVSSTFLKYDDEKVTLDIYNPLQKKRPVVILIHGAAGIEGDRAIRYKGFATDLMNKGIIAINVHYFESKKENWIKSIIKTIDYAENIDNADKSRIGIVGYSLGGTLAIKVASEDNRITSLAISAGYLPRGFTKENAKKLPKTYMVSGSKDSAMKTLNKLKEWFGEFDKDFKYKINEGYGHTVTINIFKESWKSIVTFFTKSFGINYF